MFGYVRPFKPEMRVKEYESYKAVYCALCKQLGKQYGWMSRMALNYDCTFLALLDTGIKERCLSAERKCCTCNPLKKCVYARGMDDSLFFAASTTVLLTYHKLRDDVQDNSFWKGLKARLLSFLFRRSYRKAQAAYPQLAQKAQEAMKRQAEFEASPTESLDEAADPSAGLLKAFLEALSPSPEISRILGVLGYQLGRWVYFIDALDDMEKDIKKNQFNPFVVKYHFSLESGPEEIKKIKDFSNGLLNQCVAQCLSAYQLLEIVQMKPILDNILELGLAQMQRNILFEEEKQHVRSI